jgi:hypothetical protein
LFEFVAREVANVEIFPKVFWGIFLGHIRSDSGEKPNDLLDKAQLKLSRSKTSADSLGSWASVSADAGISHHDSTRYRVDGKQRK